MLGLRVGCDQRKNLAKIFDKMSNNTNGRTKMETLQPEKHLVFCNLLLLKDLWNEIHYKDLRTTTDMVVPSGIFLKKQPKSIFCNRQYANHLIKFATCFGKCGKKVIKSDNVFAERRKESRWERKSLRRMQDEWHTQKQSDL